MDKATFYKTLEIISIVCLGLLFFLPFIYMDQLPEKIPTHFNGKGIPDGFGKKSSIWLLPGISLFLFAMLTGLNAFLKSHTPKPKHGQTQAQAEAQNVIAIELLHVLKGTILVSFVYIIWATIQTALGNWEGLGLAFTFIFLIGILGITFYYVYKMMTVKA